MADAETPIVCSRCGALVASSAQAIHDRWHNELDYRIRQAGIF